MLFQIENGRERFWQWDANQRLIISDASISEVHFYNGTGDNALVCEVYCLLYTSPSPRDS